MFPTYPSPYPFRPQHSPSIAVPVAARGCPHPLIATQPSKHSPLLFLSLSSCQKEPAQPHVAVPPLVPAPQLPNFSLHWQCWRAQAPLCGGSTAPQASRPPSSLLRVFVNVAKHELPCALAVLPGTSCSVATLQRSRGSTLKLKVAYTKQNCGCMLHVATMYRCACPVCWARNMHLETRAKSQQRRESDPCHLSNDKRATRRLPAMNVFCLNNS